ncbi:uncharacterized protein LOC143710444 isoform X3 [Siphateles boraxobius]|uniref:uncharacterized protein LOC143710444 isoform X3 n=1 Tax=Siphateles boraxobius TaxID=180520 RepID=UPI004064B484
MKFPLIVCVFLLTVSSSLSVDITVRGTEGGRVNIICRYPERYKNSYKYFYRGRYGERVIKLQSNGGESSVFRDRFSLKDNHQTRSFTVTISILKMEDAGPYGCGAGWTHYQQIQLTVIRAPVKTTRVQISTSSVSPYTNSSTEHTSTVTHQTETETTRTTTGNTTVQLYQPSIRSFVIIVTAEALVLLLIAVPLVIVAVRKKKKNKGLLSSTIVVFNPVIYDQIKDTGRFCNPEDRDTETTVFYSCVS